MDLKSLIKTKKPDELDRDKQVHVLFATSEVAPFSKTGGLGDVAAGLPKALARRGHHVSIVTPLYGHLDPERLALAKRLTPLSVPRKAKTQQAVEATVWEGRFDAGVRIFFIDCEQYFGREGVYGYDGDTFEDNADRFAFFSRAVVEFIRNFSVPVDILHINDWHTALTPIYMKYYFKEECQNIGTVMTLHNAAYQGEFPESAIADTGLPKTTFLSEKRLKHNGSINYLKGGIVYSDYITAVSPTYAEELKTEDGGFGLHELFQERADDMLGILNGADYSVWSPDHDQYLPVRYDEAGLNGKRRNKAELQHEFGLPVRPILPLIGFVGRLAEQKGVDLLVPAVRKMLDQVEGEREGFQIIFLGEGDKTLQKAIERLAKDFPDRVAAHVGYDEARAHRIIAGSDILAVPSNYEPCGLTQIYAMKYGTLPVVHAVGGLADTVTDADEHADGTGFVYHDNSESDLIDAIERATDKAGHHRQWRPLMVNAMRRDFSWAKSAQKYEEVYLRVRNERRAEAESGD
jgi:starch synthase